MGEEATNIVGTIREHDVSDEAFKDIIGENMQNWLERYGKVMVTVRENHNHDLVSLELELTYLQLVVGMLWNSTFDFRAIVRGGPEDRLGQCIEGQLEMTGSGFKNLGYVRAS